MFYEVLGKRPLVATSSTQLPSNIARCIFFVHSRPIICSLLWQKNLSTPPPINTPLHKFNIFLSGHSTSSLMKPMVGKRRARDFTTISRSFVGKRYCLFKISNHIYRYMLIWIDLSIYTCMCVNSFFDPWPEDALIAYNSPCTTVQLVEKIAQPTWS